MLNTLAPLKAAFEEYYAALLPRIHRSGVRFHVEQNEQSQPSIIFFYRKWKHTYALAPNGQLRGPANELLSPDHLYALLDRHYWSKGRYLIFLTLLLSGLFLLVVTIELSIVTLRPGANRFWLNLQWVLGGLSGLVLLASCKQLFSLKGKSPIADKLRQ
ncbi:hypothetical protein [Hymenobacter crusticola]|uniref:Uncharacterized protein n=1 Tax=Hymenobacter crusticola TaxID=1770526 RepID=A0A243W589_9BACT|nr:hypothetical protein [Hymenobacter crusticola]OUJ67408.1 hypothetical protein BXP70_28835 [Hymenobacter crusticola]